MPALLRVPLQAGGPTSRDIQSQPSPGSQRDQSPRHDSSSAACRAASCPILATFLATSGHRNQAQTPASASRVVSQVQGPQFSLWDGGRWCSLPPSPSPFFLLSPTSLVTVPLGSLSPWLSSA